MADEVEVVVGTYVELIASESEADGAFCTVSGDLDDSLTDGSEDYPLLDFKLGITAGTATELGRIDLYRVPNDGSDQGPTPAGNYLQHRVGTFVIDDALDEYYLDGVQNVRKSDKFVWQNNSGATLTATLYVRGRTVKPGA